ncbi:MAG: DNA alkylation repair protein [Planctomycetota bacterium]
MTKSDVMKFLKAEQDPRGIAHWKNLGTSTGGLQSYGIGLTRLRKYAKSLGRDPKLAEQLWRTKIYDAKVLSLLIDDPKTMTIEQAETQVEELEGGHLAHVFSSCDATLAKTSFVVELLEAWIVSKDSIRRSCGYGLLYEVSKWKKKSAPAEATFLAHVQRIEQRYPKERTGVLMAMAGALMGIGKRSRKLNTAALKVARKMGPIEFDSTGKCDPFDVAKHLTSAYLQDRLR